MPRRLLAGPAKSHDTQTLLPCPIRITPLLVKSQLLIGVNKLFGTFLPLVRQGRSGCRMTNDLLVTTLIGLQAFAPAADPPPDRLFTPARAIRLTFACRIFPHRSFDRLLPAARARG